MQEHKEKKVEYLELIYDLIFVYIIGRNNSLLHHLENGFVSTGVFLAYLLCTLAVIQIWNYSTFYINIYGRNGLRDHICLFINMYLLYFMADATSIQWEASFYKYSIAWALILLNLAVQHFIEIRNHRNAPWETRQLKIKALIILAESMLVVVHIIVYSIKGISIAYVPVFFGIIAMLISGKRNVLVPVDFAHLSERAMLYVVFTFGEMVIAVASYFSGGVNASILYFSAMAFMIVVGLLLSYGTIYNRILNREFETNGVRYMAIHMFLIFGLNNISTALEFMREAEVALIPKTLFLTCSIVIYYVFLFLTGFYAKERFAKNRKFYPVLTAVAVSFVTIMILMRNNMQLNIAVTVIYVYGLFIFIHKHANSMES